MNRRIGIVIFGIALVAKILFFSTHVPFTQDQVKDVMVARDHLAQHNYLIPYGPKASVGVYIPPLYYYLEMLGQVIMPHQFYATDFLIIFLESLTPVLIYYLIFKISANSLAAFGGAVIYSISPGVLGAASAWNPNLVPLFGLLFIVCLIEYVLNKKLWGLLGGLVSLAVLVNLHFQWFVLIPIVLVEIGVALYRIKTSWKVLLLSLVIIKVMLLPYLYFEMGHGWSNTRAAVNFLTNGGQIYEQVRKPAYVAVFFSNFYQRMMVGDLFVKSWEKQYEIFQAPIIVGSILFLAILAVNIYKARRNRYLATYLAIFGVMFIFLRFYKGAKPDFYIYVFLHFGFVLLATALTKYKWLMLSIFGVIVCTEIVAISRIPTYNDYTAFGKIKEKIVTSGQVTVEVLNQELEIPLGYFLDNKYFDGQLKDKAKYVVLVCYVRQGCDKYQPNQKTVDNVYKRNNIDPTDYSYNWPHYDSKSSFVVEAGRYTANFIRVN